MNRTSFAFVVLPALALGGCASTLSGVGGVDRYACKAPEGALCTSVSGIYANSVHGVLPQANSPGRKLEAALPQYGARFNVPMKSEAPSSAALRSHPRVLRLWIAPWEDADGDLNEDSLVHVVIDTGRWLIEHVRPAARSHLDGVAPPIAPTQEAPPAAAPSEVMRNPTPLPLPGGTLAPGADPAPRER